MPPAQEFDVDEFRDVCFVIMPFGTKTVGEGLAARSIDFNHVFDSVFEPAISAVALPAREGGGHLRAVRTDREFHSGHISQRMFELIEYSRFALADITGLNANVFYELGARHRANESGTAIFRQGTDAPIPFDINQINAVPYEIEPESSRAESQRLVTRVLTDSLVRNAWDSPIRLALRHQSEFVSSGTDAGDELEATLRGAENAVRDADPEKAAALYRRAAELDPANPLHDIKASQWPKSQGDWDSVIPLLQSALAKEANLSPEEGASTYADAYRELGIAQNKRDSGVLPRAGEESLRLAVHHNPGDFDAWASLGGVLKRAGDHAGSLECYEKAVEISNGHPYPLLNVVKLRIEAIGELELDPTTMRQLVKAEGFREGHVTNEPAIDAPWSYFDLAEIRLYLGEIDAAVETARAGLEQSPAEWMARTFLSSLELVPAGAVDGLDRLVELVHEHLEPD